MIKLAIQLPEWLHKSIHGVAEQVGNTIDQFLVSAAAEKVAVMRSLEYLRKEAAQGRREDFERFLAAVVDRESIETDRMPD